MKEIIKIYMVPVVLISILVLFNNQSFSQEVQLPEEATQPETQTEVPLAETAQPETQWLWGEVVSVDTASGQIVLKYLDYETDAEKEITIYTNPETTFENVTTLAEIETKDTASIDYIVTPEGKSIAKHISIEKIEELPVEPPAEPSESETPQP